MDEAENDEPSMCRLGVVVPHNHRPGGQLAKGCRCRKRNADAAEYAETKCYLCHGHPFVEVLFHNPAQSPYSATRRQPSEEEEQVWQTVPVQPRRAVFRSLPVGTRLVMSVATLGKVNKFKFGNKT